MVSLSTTLATNAIVEGRGGMVGLIFIGERKPTGEFPAQKIALISGGHNLYGIPFCDYPIVAIGAPVKSYLPAVGEILNTEVIIPEHSEVANAIGAAVGKVSERVTVIIKPGFKVHAPWGYETFMEIEEARNSVLSKGKVNAIENAQKAGILNPEIIVNHDVSSCETSFGKVFLGEHFEIIASGYPQRVNEHSA